MKNLKYTSLAIFIVVLTSLFTIGCGEDSVVPPNNGGSGSGWHPAINITQGQNFVYSNDSLLPGGGHVWTGVRTTDVVQAQITMDGKLCSPVFSTNFDTGTGQTSTATYFVSYTQSEGKFYQYGIGNLINPGQTPKWDVVADFSVARNTSYLISNINYTTTIPGLGTVTFTGPLNGKIVDSTTITTTGPAPHSVSCYKIELNAKVSGTVPPSIPVSADIYIYYYLGYASPTGLVELNLMPFSFTVSGVPGIAPQPGYDRKLYTHNP